ncbi:hypothetical protein QBC40DRAFT_188806, partial [Triangularia verruculosa]
LALAVLSVVARFYIRVSFGHGIKIDDYLILTSVVGLAVCGSLMLWVYIVAANGLWLVDEPVEGQLGLSGHDLDRITLYLKTIYGVAILYFAVSGTAKLGILLMYWRIFRSDNTFKILLPLIETLVFVWCLSGIIATVLNCIPVEKAWALPVNDERYCYNYNIFWLATGIVEVVLDIIILALPLASLQKLKIPLSSKLSAGGIFVVVTGIVKVVLGYSPMSPNPNQFKTVLWSTLHLTTAIICATLPIMDLVLRRIRNSRLVQLAIGSVLSTKKNTINNSSSKGFSRVSDREDRHYGGSRERNSGIPLRVVASQNA